MRINAVGTKPDLVLEPPGLGRLRTLSLFDNDLIASIIHYGLLVGGVGSPNKLIF